MASSTAEDYMKCIYVAQERFEGGLVPTGQIASALRVAPGTATAMVKSLADQGLLVYEPYAGVKLSAKGIELAVRVLRRHRLVELFLVRIMGMSWSEVHGEAEVLEHAVSDRLIERMDVMLGRPSTDPHGDPIPSSGGEIPQSDHSDLLGCSLGGRVRVARVTDQRKEFLRLLERHRILPGVRVRVAERDEVAETVEIHPEDGEVLRLGFRAASKILVEPTEDDRRAT